MESGKSEKLFARRLLPEKFYVSLVTRLVLIIVTSLLFSFSVQLIGKEYLVVTINLGILLIAEGISFYLFIGNIDRDISRMFIAIRNNQFSDSISTADRRKGFAHFRRLMDELNLLVREKAMELHQNEILMGEIIEMSPGALLLYDEKGKVITINRAARRVLGVTTMEMISELDNVGMGLYQAINNSVCGKAVKTEAVSPAGSLSKKGYTLLVQKETFITSGGTINILALQDIRQAVMNQEIESWQKIIRVIRHEILNSLSPIAAITGSLNDQISGKTGNLIDGSTIDNELLRRIKSGLATIYDSSRSLLGFIQRYRQLSTIPRPDMALSDISQTVAECINLFREEFATRNIRLNFESIEAPILCSFDNELIKLSIINILKNAMVALSGHPEPEIAVTINSAGCNIVINISDNGQGIKPEIADDIFVPFFTTRSDGSGIGLSLARQIAVMHGGELELAATGEKGSTFRMILPAP